MAGPAVVHGVEAARAGAALAAELARASAPSLTLLYLDDFDTIAHELGPDDRRSEAVALDLLAAVEQELVDALAGPPRARSCSCSPTTASSRPIPSAASTSTSAARSSCRSADGADGRPLAPAGSARDLFLHVREGALDEALGLLQQLFGDDAWVAPTAQLAADGIFGPVISNRFTERVGDIVVLPRAGIEAWWHEPGRFEQSLHGHHGGLEPAEAETWLGALVP